MTVEGSKVVSTVILQATAEVMKDGATCEASNEHGTDSKTFMVSLKRGQYQDLMDEASSCLFFFPHVYFLEAFDV